MTIRLHRLSEKLSANAGLEIPMRFDPFSGRVPETLEFSRLHIIDVVLQGGLVSLLVLSL